MNQFNLNGQAVEAHVPDDTPLGYVLRNQLGMKSVKLGCESEQCGACLVLVDDEVRHSCVMPVATVAGAAIRTVEGLSTDAVGGAVQSALETHNASQCGFCLSGIIMAATGLFEVNSTPSLDEIKSALAGNLCRCGAHPRVLRALAELARR